jgi:maltose O-acetyltransferase
MRRVRWLKLKLAGADIPYNIQLPESLLVGDARGFECEHHAYFSDGCKIVIGSSTSETGRLRIGPHFYMNHYSIIDCHYSITIGESVMIGPHVYICDFDHEIPSQVGQGWSLNETGKPVHIEREVWIGAGAIILKGVRIGEGAVIGAGSIVTKDVEAGAIVAGNPARLVRMRRSGFEDNPSTSVPEGKDLIGAQAG